MSRDDLERIDPTLDRLSRRQALRRLGLIGAAAAAGPEPPRGLRQQWRWLLRDHSAAAPAGATATGSAAAGGGSVGDQIATLLKIDPSGKNGKGIDFQMGVVLALTGNGSFYGKTMSRGTDLAVKHIAAAGGPNIKVIYKDHKSGDPKAGTTADQRARRGEGAGQAGLLRRRPRRHVRRHEAVQDLHARRRRRHEHLRPGAPLLLGHPGHHARTTPYPGLFMYIEDRRSRTRRRSA